MKDDEFYSTLSKMARQSGDEMRTFIAENHIFDAGLSFDFKILPLLIPGILKNVREGLDS